MARKAWPWMARRSGAACGSKRAAARCMRESAFCHAHGVVLAHEPIEPGQGTDKAEAELTVAPALLARVAWPGRVLTGDALFCQRNLCRQVREAGGDYLLLVKENQPQLLADIRLLFEPLPGSLPLLDRRETTQHARGHGRPRRSATWSPPPI